MGQPLVAEETGVGIEIRKGGGIGRTGEVAAMLGMGAVVVLRPETVKGEAEVLPALRLVRVGGAELRRPGKVKEVEVEGGGTGWCGTAGAATFSRAGATAFSRGVRTRAGELRRALSRLGLPAAGAENEAEKKY